MASTGAKVSAPNQSVYSVIGQKIISVNFFQWAIMIWKYSAGDMGSIPGSGKAPGEGNGDPLQYSCLENPRDRGACWAMVHGVESKTTFWASQVAQIIKNPPAVQETQIWSLGQEAPMEKAMATHSRILAWKILMDRGDWQATVHGIAKSWTQLND